MIVRSLVFHLVALVLWFASVAMVFGQEPRGRLLLREVYDLDGKRIAIEEYTDAPAPARPAQAKEACPPKKEAAKEYKIINGYWYVGEGDDWVLMPGQVKTRSAAPPLSSPGYDPDHTCNRCGASQHVVSGFNADGTHNHRCPRCGNVWKH